MFYLSNGAVIEIILIFEIVHKRDINDENGGKLVLGGSDKTLYKGEMQYLEAHPNISENDGLWYIGMDSISIGDESIGCNDGCLSVFDTGSSGIAGPVDEIKRIHQIIGAEYDESNTAIVNCDEVDNLPVITFNFGGHKFDLQGKDYILRIAEEDQQEQCISGFDGLESDQYIMGDPFHRKYYTEYDVGKTRIGLAEAA